jgi:hypothetical protein
MFRQIFKAVAVSVTIPLIGMLLLMLGEKTGVMPLSVSTFVRRHLFLILLVVLAAMVLPLLRKALRER